MNGIDGNLKNSHQPIIKNNFRIKKVANIALITFSTLLTSTAIASTITGFALGFTVSSVIAPAICGAIVLISLTALAVLGFLKGWEFLTPHLPSFLRIPANYIQSSVCGIISSVALAIIWPIDYSKKNIKPKEVDPSKPLLIGIHGFLGSSNNWIYHFSRLKKAGHKNLATVNLGNWFLSIDDYIEKVRNLVLEYKNKSPLPADGKLKVQFLCHSMGGLVARYYNQKYSKIDGIEVEDIITLGTPLDGTRVAYLAFGLSGAGRQMHPKSKFIRNLQDETNKNETTKHYHIASLCDFIVNVDSALEGNGKKTILDATGHVSLLFSDKTSDLIIEYLKNSETKV